MTQEEKLAYAAGIVDGEGCVGIYNTRPKLDTRSAFYQLTLRVCMKAPEPVEFLYRLFGGGVHVMASKGPGKPGPYFTWQARNRQAEVCLQQLVPFLLNKRREAVLALKFGEFRRAQRAGHKRSVRYTPEMLKARDAYVDEMKSLKKTMASPTLEKIRTEVP